LSVLTYFQARGKEDAPVEDVEQVTTAVSDPNLILAVLALTSVVFFIALPLGSILHRFIRPLTPDDDTLPILASGLILFLLCFAIVAGLLLRSGLALALSLPLTLLLAALAALGVTGLSAWWLKRGLARGRARIDPEEHVFSVWDEDQRKRRRKFRGRW
jgi:hypothetical protein